MEHFQTVTNRQETYSYKWDQLDTIFNNDNLIPLWVADMDFKAPEAVNDVLKKRAEHGIYGYTVITDSIRDSVVQWNKKRHNWDISADWLTFSPGVIASLHIAIQSFTTESDKILIQTPVYTPFFNIIKNGNRQIVTNSLIEKDGKYEIDFEDFEEKLSDGVKAFVLCSPHNPVGRVWKREELDKIAELCLKYNVLILADEIHADLVFKPNKHIPIASLSEEIAQQTITFMSPTKTFNLAGLQISYIVTADIRKRRKMSQELNQLGFSMLNTMGTLAIEVAYREGEEWLEQLLSVIESNKNYVKSKLENKTGGKLRVIDAEGTYLVWIDCHKLNMDSTQLQKFMIHKARVGLNAGISYGSEGEHFMRLNLACPKETLVEGVTRIINAVNEL